MGGGLSDSAGAGLHLPCAPQVDSVCEDTRQTGLQELGEGADRYARHLLRVPGAEALTYFAIRRKGSSSPEQIFFLRNGDVLFAEDNRRVDREAFDAMFRIEGYAGWGLAYPKQFPAEFYGR